MSRTHAHQGGHLRLRDQWAALLVDLRRPLLPSAIAPPRSDAACPPKGGLAVVLEGYTGLPPTVADRIKALGAMLREDAEDGDLSLDSVNGLCRFLANHAVRIPELMADGDGQLVAEWLDERAGRLSMRFRADGLAEFALAGGADAGGPNRVRLCGSEEPARAARSVRAVTGRFPYS